MKNMWGVSNNFCYLSLNLFLLSAFFMLYLFLNLFEMPQNVIYSKFVNKR